MFKKIMMTLLASVCLLTSATAVTEYATPQTVQAATKGKVQVKGSKKVRLYTSKGKRLITTLTPVENILIPKKVI